MPETHTTLDTLRQLAQLLPYLIELQMGCKVEPEMQWTYDAHTLALKLFKHAASVNVLVRGTSFVSSTNHRLDMFDYASGNAIARAALENYLVFSFLFDAKELKRSEFRHLTWRIGSLLDRQKYKSFKIENNLKKATEKKTADVLIARMKTDPYFLELKKDQQDKLLNGNWRMSFQWKHLAAQAGLDEFYFLNTYKHMCGYSHSGYLSTVQIQESWSSIEDQKTMTQAVTITTNNVLAYFILKYVEFFPAARHALDARPQDKRLVVSWAPTPADWKSFRTAQGV